MLSIAEKLPEQVETKKCREAESLVCPKKREARRPHPMPCWRAGGWWRQRASGHPEIARTRISSHSVVGFAVFPLLEVLWKTLFNACSHPTGISYCKQEGCCIFGRKTLESCSLLLTRQHMGICKARSKGCSELKVRQRGHIYS